MAGRIAYLGNISPQGLVLDLDAAIKGSYPKTGSTWFDISNNGNDGTLTNGPLYTGSNYGALVFNGNNTYVNCGNGGSLKITGPITLSSFFKANAFTVDYQAIITMGDDSYRLQRHYNTSQLAFGSRNLGLIDLTSSISITTGSWYSATAVYDGSFMNLYINGAPNSKGAASGSFPTSSYNLYVGSNQQYPTRIWSGSIANTQIYNQALTQFQVWQNFNAYKSRYGIPDIVTDSLVLNLDAGNPYSYLSGSSGTTWTNTVAVSSSISGTLVNGPVYSNGAITFDGVNDYVKLTSNSSVDVNTLTWSAFVQGVYSSQPGFFFIGNDVGAAISPYKIFIGVLNSGGLKLRINYNNVATVNLGSLTDNTLYHLTITYDGAITNMYVNGSSIGTSTNMSGSLNSKTFSYIGSTAGATEFFNGKIFNTLLYNRALSAAEVQQNFNALRGRYGI